MTVFPNVPDVPGVPSLPRDPSVSQANTATLDQQDTVPLSGQPSRPVWGLYKNGVNVITADNVVSFEYRQEWDLLTYPVEQGAFESYNKVSTPFDARFRFSSGGDDTNRDNLLLAVETAGASLDLYDAYMPERVYNNVNINHYDFRRQSDRGVGLLTVDVWVLEIRQQAAAAFANTKTPSGTQTSNTGTVQTTNPTGPLVLKNPSGRPLILQSVQ